MADKIMDLYYQQKERDLESAFLQPEKFDAEYLERYRKTMEHHQKQSIDFLLDSMAQLTNLRDKHQDDFELQKLIWDNIQITKECIAEEMQNDY